MKSKAVEHFTIKVTRQHIVDGLPTPSMSNTQWYCWINPITLAVAQHLPETTSAEILYDPVSEKPIGIRTHPMDNDSTKIKIWSMPQIVKDRLGRFLMERYMDPFAFTLQPERRVSNNED